MYRRKKRGNLKPDKSTLLFNLKPILSSRNIIHPTAYLIKIGLSNTTATKMLKGEAVLVSLNQLTTLCLHLNCTPNDLFVLRDMQLPDGHALHTLKTVEEASKSTAISEWLAGKTMAEVEELLKK